MFSAKAMCHPKPIHLSLKAYYTDFMAYPALSRFAPVLSRRFMQIVTMHNAGKRISTVTELPNSNFIRD